MITKRNKKIEFRVTEQEYLFFTAIAEMKGVPLSFLIRQLLKEEYSDEIESLEHLIRC